MTEDLKFRDEYTGVLEYRSRTIDGCELRETPDGTGGQLLTFTGYASIVDTPYTMTDFLGDYTETIQRNAFDRTLAESPDVNFLMNHEGVSMARTKSGSLKLSVDNKGLHTEARLDPRRPDVQILRYALEAGDIDEMSFAFRVNKQEWNGDYDERSILEVNLHHGDTSAVNFGANPHTAGSTGLRSLSREERGLMRELRAAAMNPASAATLKHVLSLAQTSDTAVDELLVVLSDYLGVPNPDKAQDATMKPDGTSATTPPAAPVQKSHPLDLYLARAHALRLR